MKIIPLRTRRSSNRGLPQDFGKYGRSRSTCASDNQKRSLIIPPHFESMNHVASRRSNGFMGPGSKDFSLPRQMFRYVSILGIEELNKDFNYWTSEIALSFHF
jgi:hypothetical protein